MDRIDIQLWLSPVDPGKLVERIAAESSAAVAARVQHARDVQRARFEAENKVLTPEKRIFCNAAMNNRQIEKYCPLDPACKALLQRIIERMGLSARACTRIIKLARTIADLDCQPDILPQHLSAAAGYRFLDKQNIFD